MEKELFRMSPAKLERRYQAAIHSAGTLDPHSRRIVAIKLDRMNSLVGIPFENRELIMLDLAKFVESRQRIMARRNGSRHNGK